MSKYDRPTFRWINYPIYWPETDVALAEAVAEHPMQQFRNYALTGYEQYRRYNNGRNFRR